MTKHEIKKLALENASLKRLLSQRDKKILSIKEEVNSLKKEKKAIKYKLERSKSHEKKIKSELVEAQKKTLECS